MCTSSSLDFPLTPENALNSVTKLLLHHHLCCGEKNNIDSWGRIVLQLARVQKVVFMFCVAHFLVGEEGNTDTNIPVNPGTILGRSCLCVCCSNRGIVASVSSGKLTMRRPWHESLLRIQGHSCLTTLFAPHSSSLEHAKLPFSS